MARKKISKADYLKYLRRHKPGPNSEQFRSDDAFKGSRLAAKRMAQASLASKHLRKALMLLPDTFTQKELHNRFTKQINSMLKAMPKDKSPRINSLPWEQLRFFELNKDKSLGLLMHQPYKLSIDKNKGSIRISIPGYQSSPTIRSKPGNDLVRIFAAAAAIDFAKNITDADYAATDYISVYADKLVDIDLSLQIKGPITLPLFVALGISCTQEINKNLYELNNLRFMGLQIIEAQNAVPKRRTPLEKTVSVKRKKKK